MNSDKWLVASFASTILTLLLLTWVAINLIADPVTPLAYGIGLFDEAWQKAHEGDELDGDEDKVAVVATEVTDLSPTNTPMSMLPSPPAIEATATTEVASVTRASETPIQVAEAPSTNTPTETPTQEVPTPTPVPPSPTPTTVPPTETPTTILTEVEPTVVVEPTAIPTEIPTQAPPPQPTQAPELAIESITTFRVVNAGNSEQGIPGALVRVTTNGHMIPVGRLTDEDGYAQIPLEQVDMGEDGTGIVSVSVDRQGVYWTSALVEYNPTTRSLEAKVTLSNGVLGQITGFDMNVLPVSFEEEKLGDTFELTFVYPNVVTAEKAYEIVTTMATVKGYESFAGEGVQCFADTYDMMTVPSWQHYRDANGYSIRLDQVPPQGFGSPYLKDLGPNANPAAIPGFRCTAPGSHDLFVVEQCGNLVYYVEPEFRQKEGV